LKQLGVKVSEEYNINKLKIEEGIQQENKNYTEIRIERQE
jgi:hypothetical protein